MILLAGAVFLPSLVFANSATVSWLANAEPDLAKYRVYWSTTVGSYGSYKAEVPKGTHSYVANNLTAGQTYHFVLTAVDTSGNESGFSSPPASKTISGGSVPAAPALGSPANGARVPGSAVTFTWQASAGATDYNVKIYTSTGWLTYNTWVGNTTSHTVTGFDNTGRSFTWSVTARSSAGQSPESARWAFTNDGQSTPTVPTAPALTSPANGANVPGTSVTFQWQAVQGATDYNLRVTDASGGSAYNAWVGNAQSFTVNGFPNNGGTYNWTVTARNSAGTGPASAARSFVNGASSTPTVPAAPALTAPANGARVPGNAVTFTWQAVQGATDYTIKIYTGSGWLTYDRSVGNTTSHTVTGFDNTGRSFAWSVTARNSSGQSPESARWAFTNEGQSAPTVPTAPVLVSPADGARVSGSSVTFQWQPVAGASNYNLRIYTSSGWLTYDRWVGNATSFTVTGFDNTGRSFTWAVSASSAAGQGPASPRASFVNR